MTASVNAASAACSACGARDVTESWSVYRRTVADTVFWTRIVSRDCSACGRVSLPACELGWFQMAVARHLAHIGARGPEELALMRSALGLSCSQLARELGIPAEAAAQWEEDSAIAPADSIAAFHQLVIERIGTDPLLPIGLRPLRD